MRGQRGFTLVEMLVAMTMSTIVVFAASAVIITSLHVTNSVTGRITALGQGRTGIEALLGQLNSGCLVNSVSPVMASTATGISPVVSSGGNSLVFVSGVGDSASPTPTEHVVTLTSNGNLLDAAYPYAGTTANLATPSAWQFSSTPSSTLNLGENVSAGSNQMFTYYAYSSVSGTDSLLGATALATPLTAATAPTVAEVDLDFRFNPPGNNYNSTSTSELQDSAVFSLSADGTGSQNAPCQ